MNERWQKAVLEAIHCPSAPWLPELSDVLVSSGWLSLRQEQEISPENYSTARVMRRENAAFGASQLISGPNVAVGLSGSIEFLEDDVQSQFASDSYRFSTVSQTATEGLVETLSMAVRHIALNPSLHASINPLIRSIHLLQTDAENCDISFSDPQLPFSIFVSVSPKDVPDSSLRLAEGIVHESMHLQLSLLEKIVPLIPASSSKYFSPWKSEYRNASGLLHALYVFTVIDSWLKELPSFADKYSKKRRGEIAAQIREIESFRSAELTVGGNLLRSYLFAQH